MPPNLPQGRTVCNNARRVYRSLPLGFVAHQWWFRLTCGLVWSSRNLYHATHIIVPGWLMNFVCMQMDCIITTNNPSTDGGGIELPQCKI